MKKYITIYMITTACVMASDEELSRMYGTATPHIAATTQEVQAVKEEIKPALVVTPTSEVKPSKPIVLNKEQGEMHNVHTGGVKQSFGKALAKDSVKQGNMTDSTLSGGIVQTFKEAVSDHVSQGNMSGSTIQGDVEQTFGDDDF